MPTLRLVYLTDQQYAGLMTDHAQHAGAANNTTRTAEEQLPSINQEQTRLPIAADATRNASSTKPPVDDDEKKVDEQSDHEEDNDCHLDTLLQEATRIDGVNRRSFGSHAVRHQQVQQEMALSSNKESDNDSLSSERV
jgi:hypothetical protein